MKLSAFVLTAAVVTAPLLATLVHAADTSLSAIKDSTILSSTVTCSNCPEENCNKCTRGHEPTLRANTGGLAFVRSLVSFQLPVPATSVTKCTVEFPAMKEQLASPLNVTVSMAASSDWNEDTVTAENAPDSADPFTGAPVLAESNIPEIDITSACKNAGNDGQFSIYLGTQVGRFEISSKDAGKPAMLHVTHN
ncbi:hypothetical protein GQ42DRAFT_74656 [Ramicandelaber brevisporus]|nr:hypothetical protein GQ42DRAFT_74656 [Ramicandelaber brevisporus]